MQLWVARLGKLWVVRLGQARWHGEQLAGACDVGGAIAVGEQSVVADAVQAPGQHVRQEAANELVGGSVMVLKRPGPSIR